MRVIAGRYRGRILDTVRDHSVRPATGRVRQTVFDMLTHRKDFEGIAILDLFAGSGSLGIESLSRGAGHAVFVESDQRAAAIIEKNVRTLQCEHSTEIRTMDALRFVAADSRQFDIVFADPPYVYAQTHAIPSLVFSSGRVKRDGYLIIEHARGQQFDDTPGCAAGPARAFGRTVVTFFTSTSQPVQP